MSVIELKVFVGNSSTIFEEPISLEVSSDSTIRQLKTQFYRICGVSPNYQVWIFRNTIAVNEDTMESLQVTSKHFGVVYVEGDLEKVVQREPTQPDELPIKFRKALSVKYSGAELCVRPVGKTPQERPASTTWKCSQCQTENASELLLCRCCECPAKGSLKTSVANRFEECRASMPNNYTLQLRKEKTVEDGHSDWKQPNRRTSFDGNTSNIDNKWTCSSCRNTNPKQETSCLKCGQLLRRESSAAISQSKVDEMRVRAYGWTCPSCHTVNEATLPRCCICMTERPVHYRLPSEEHLTANDIQRLREQNLAKMAQRKFQADLERHPSELAITDNRQWACEACTCLNAPNHLNCSICGTLRYPGIKLATLDEARTGHGARKTWQCRLCMVVNELGSRFCSNCDNEQPQAPGKPNLPDVHPRLPRRDVPDMEMNQIYEEGGRQKRDSLVVKGGLAEWDCPICTCRNPPNQLNCRSCGR